MERFGRNGTGLLHLGTVPQQANAATRQSDVAKG